MLAAIYGLSGPQLTPDERDFFREAEPAGYVIFLRNIVDRDQLRALTDDLRELSGRDDLPIMIDQEGGRVQRMGPPHWPAYPTGGAFDALYERAPMSAIEAARANAEALALDLAEVGINVNLAPLLDVRAPGAHDAIGDRAFGHEPTRVAALGRAVLEGFARGGVVGVIKHMPGQGRAPVDSHHDLPVVDADEEALARDLEPFAALSAAAGMGMTNHVLYPAWDGKRPATLSPIVIGEIIRGRIGFDGFLMSDDIDMKALSGTPGEKAAGATAAGCDVALDCWGRMDDMIDIANRTPALSENGHRRLERAMAMRLQPEPGRLTELTAKRDRLLAYA